MMGQSNGNSTKFASCDVHRFIYFAISEYRNRPGRLTYIGPRRHDQRHSVFRISDDDDLCIRRMRELLRGFDSFPRQELIADAAAHDTLKIRDTLSFDRLTLCFLAFLFKD